MKILVISDIHGNLPALEAVLNSVYDFEILLFAGDLAGYFPFVDEVVQILSTQKNCLCVMGNHDAVLIDYMVTTNSYSADLALKIQKQFVAKDSLAFIEALPIFIKFILNGKTISLFHGSPSDYINGRDKYWESNPLLPGVYINGHTHIQNYFENESKDIIVVNPGGTGFPRDGNPDASFAIIDSDNWNVTFHRVPYDITRLIEKCNLVGLPPHFAKSIKKGLWVSYNE